MGNCPKCGNGISSVRLSAISVKATPQNWAGVSYACAGCNTVISVGIDPIALKSDTVAEVTAEVLKQLRRG